MADEKTIKKPLSQLQSEALAVIKAWVHYLEALNDYQVQLDSTTPPAGGPPNPPGIPPR